MANELQVDDDAARVLASDLAGIAADAAQTLQRLQLFLTKQGTDFGADTTGRAFGQSYIPSEQTGLVNFRDTVQSLAGEAQNISSYLNSVTLADRETIPTLQGAGSASDGNAAPQQAPSTAVRPQQSPVESPVSPQLPVAERTSASAGEKPTASGQPAVSQIPRVVPRTRPVRRTCLTRAAHLPPRSRPR